MQNFNGHPELLKALTKYEKDFAEFEDACLKVTDFYFENRYPLRVTTPVVRTNLEKLFDQADALIARIQSRAAPPETSAE